MTKTSTSRKAGTTKTSAPRSTGRRKAGSGAAKGFTQGQELGIGGTKEVPITVAALPDKGYTKRELAPEEYPFSKLTPAVKQGDEIVGPSFFIPETDNPDRLIATARKRHKKEGISFWTRKASEKVGSRKVQGKRVWRAE